MANPARKGNWDNWTEGQGNWDDWSKQIKNTWKNLTDEEMGKIENNPEAIYTSLSQHYGLTNAQVDKQMTEFASKMGKGTYAGGRSEGSDIGRGNRTAANPSERQFAGSGEYTRHPEKGNMPKPGQGGDWSNQKPGQGTTQGAGKGTGFGGKESR